MPIDPEEVACLERIGVGPEDDAPRLDYAAWLARAGDPDRGDFIRLQCEAARLPDGDPRRETLRERAQELLVSGRDRWLGPFATKPHWPTFRRGIPKDWSASLASEQGSPTEAEVLAAAECPILYAAVELEIGCNGGLSDAGARALAASPFVRRLERLDLRDVRHSEEALRVLLESPQLARVRRLVLDGGTSADWCGTSYTWPAIGDGHVRVLARSPASARLAELRVRHNELSDAAASALARSPHLAGLEWLCALEGNGLTAAGDAELRGRFGERVE